MSVRPIHAHVEDANRFSLRDIFTNVATNTEGAAAVEPKPVLSFSLSPSAPTNHATMPMKAPLLRPQSGLRFQLHGFARKDVISERSPTVAPNIISASFLRSAAPVASKATDVEVMRLKALSEDATAKLKKATERLTNVEAALSRSNTTLIHERGASNKRITLLSAQLSAIQESEAKLAATVAEMPKIGANGFKYDIEGALKMEDEIELHKSTAKSLEENIHDLKMQLAASKDEASALRSDVEQARACADCAQNAHATTTKELVALEEKQALATSATGVADVEATQKLESLKKEYDTLASTAAFYQRESTATLDALKSQSAAELETQALQHSAAVDELQRQLLEHSTAAKEHGEIVIKLETALANSEQTVARLEKTIQDQELSIGEFRGAMKLMTETTVTLKQQLEDYSKAAETEAEAEIEAEADSDLLREYEARRARAVETESCLKAAQQSGDEANIESAALAHHRATHLARRALRAVENPWCASERPPITGVEEAPVNVMGAEISACCSKHEGFRNTSSLALDGSSVDFGAQFFVADDDELVQTESSSQTSQQLLVNAVVGDLKQLLKEAKDTYATLLHENELTESTGSL